MTNERFILFMGILVGCIITLTTFVLPSPFSVKEVRLNLYDGTDIIIVAGGTGSSIEIETNNLALADRKEYVKRLSALIDEIKEANSGESNDR